jgi:hypothetical protein
MRLVDFILTLRLPPLQPPQRKLLSPILPSRLQSALAQRLPPSPRLLELQPLRLLEHRPVLLPPLSPLRLPPRLSALSPLSLLCLLALPLTRVVGIYDLR